MAKSNKFEEMLEHLVNDNRAKAEELFHEIVVEKSRDIYENLLADDVEDKEVEEKAKEDDEETNEADKAKDDKQKHPGDKKMADADADKDSDKTNEDFDLDEFEVEADDDAMMGGDMDMDMKGDMDMDMDGDMADDEGGMEDEGEPATKGDIMDLEAELEDLKAEFEELLKDQDGDEEGDEEDSMDMGDEEEEGEEEPEEESLAYEADDEDEDEEMDESKSPAQQMREYVEKVTTPSNTEGADNKKSIVASKNDMGGTASNLAQGGDGGKGGTQGGLANPTTKEDSAGNVNVPGGKASKSMKAMPKGHGAEKKGAGETADNKKSTIGS